MTRTPISGTDAAWWKMDTPSNRVIITGLLRLETKVELERLVATLDSGIAAFPQFRSRIVERGWRMPVWEEAPEFRTASHVDLYPSISPVEFDKLEEIVGRLMGEALPDNLPLWRVTLVHEAAGGSAIICRIHHAIGDGAALIHFLLSLAEGADEGQVHVRRPARTAWYEPFRFAAAMVATPFRILFTPPEGKNPFRGTLGSAKNAAWSAPLSLGTIKAIGKASGSTVNDVLVAAVTGALRPILAAGDTRKARAAIPVALRAFGATPELGNRLGIALLDLPVDVAEPGERLAVVRKRLNALKRSPQALFTFGVLWLAGYLPTWLARAPAWLLGTKITAVLTNVPGPQTPLRLAGVLITQMIFWVPQAGNCGLGVSVLSYNGAVTVGVTVDARLTPSPDEITASFQREINALAALTRDV